jgi:hypothetical protein
MYLFLGVIIAFSFFTIISDRDVSFSCFAKIEAFSVAFSVFKFILAKAVDRFFAIFSAFVRFLS